MKCDRILKSVALTLATFLALVGCNNDDNGNSNQDDGPDGMPNIVELATSIDELSTLVAALETAEAGLETTLSDAGTLTVFAPTNAAFTALFSSLEDYSSLADFDTDEEKALLAEILKYHVVASAALMSGTLSDGNTLTTLQGESISIVLDEGVFVGDATDDLARVIDADNEASNGIVHIVNKVLLPQEVVDQLFPTPSLIEFVGNHGDFGLLDEAIATAGLTDALDGDGPFTLFAPTDSAFEDLLDALGDFGTLSDFDTDEELELLRNILQYHVIGSRVLSPDLSNDQELTTLQGESLTVTVSDDGIFIQDASLEDAVVENADNIVSNGVVHGIDKVLLPQAIIEQLFPTVTVVDIIENNSDLSLLGEAIEQANLLETLEGEGPYTVFAPSNEAINTLFDLLGDDFNSFADFDSPLEISILRRILEYHVVRQRLPSTSLSAGSLQTLSNETLNVVVTDNRLGLADATETAINFLILDQTADNGVVHTVDKILLSQEVVDTLARLGIDVNDPQAGLPTIADLVTDNDQLEFLEEALRITGLLETLDGAGPYTVFAPSNETLSLLFSLVGSTTNNLDEFDLDFEIDLLRDILLYHVVSGRIGSNDLVVGEIDTLLGDPIEVLLRDAGFVLTDATDLLAHLTTTDIPAANGVIHIVDRILLPESVIAAIVDRTESTFERILEYLRGHETLRTALLMASEEVEELLSESEPFTFFLPNEQAFTDLFEQLEGIDSLEDFDTEAELRLLATILEYHLIRGSKALSTDLIDGQAITTAQGETITIEISNGVSLSDKTEVPARVTSADNLILNGVLHFIDKVLLPQEVLDQL